MKSLLVTLLIATSNLMAAETTLVKSCKATFEGEMFNNVVTSQVSIYKKNNSFEATLITIQDETSTTTKEKVAFEENLVRPNIIQTITIDNASDAELNSLNSAERLVLHAASVEEVGMKSGLDLNLIRSAKVFFVGEITNMGAFAVVEAYDANKKLLGSFVGGFLVAPCL